MSIIGRKGLIVVHRKELMDQMIGHLEKAGFAVGKIQGGKSLDAAAYKGFPKDVYVGMAATLCTAHKKLSASFTKLTEVIEVIAIDEVQRSGAEKYYNMIMAFDAPYRFGTSATIKGRSDGADLMLHALTGDVVAHVSERELMDDEWLSEPRIYILPVKSDHSNMYDWAEIYSEAIVNNKERNGLIADAFMDLFKAGKSILVICNYIEHGKLLQEAINDRMLSWANETDQSFPAVDFVHGSTPKMIREAKVNAIRRGDIQGIIMSSISDEGLDLPDLDAVIVAAAGKSPIKALQRLGRGIRKKESGECWFFDFVDQDGGMLEDHSDSRLRAYESRDFEVNVCSYREFLNDLNESSGVD
jgi:superfamily II DNA or RNA helicase